ncbi:hypothetical protein [Polynucleobacter necessarius]|uniref:hypothetical protein n=1 Tax=Polynucleobacter necessarius TaxID=576610 RepID=UPI001E4D3FC7|nr:hypothetical protein [Polynucleobacter necessarius]
MNVAEAAPISLAAITLASGVGALLGLKNKILRYKAAVLMAIFGLVLSPIGLMGIAMYSKCASIDSL